jgi:hypothetical protein
VSNASGPPRGRGGSRGDRQGPGSPPPRAELGRGGSEVVLRWTGGDELRRRDRGRRAGGARRRHPAQAALPRG